MWRNDQRLASQFVVIGVAILFFSTRYVNIEKGMNGTGSEGKGGERNFKSRYHIAFDIFFSQSNISTTPLESLSRKS